jgi:hypothetical protein
LHRNELEFTYEFIGNFHGKIGKLLTTTQHNNPPSHENDDAHVIYWTPLTPQVQNAIYFGMATVELKRQKNSTDNRTPKIFEIIFKISLYATVELQVGSFIRWSLQRQ